MVKSPSSHPNKSGVLRQLELSTSFIYKISLKEIEADSCFLPKGGRVGLSEQLTWREVAASTEFCSPSRTDLPSRSGYEVQNNRRALETCSFVEIKKKKSQNTWGPENEMTSRRSYSIPQTCPPKGRAQRTSSTFPLGLCESLTLCPSVQRGQRQFSFLNEHC